VVLLAKYFNDKMSIEMAIRGVLSFREADAAGYF
jgi:hypothetical protein